MLTIALMVVVNNQLFKKIINIKTKMSSNSSLFALNTNEKSAFYLCLSKSRKLLLIIHNFVWT